MPRQTVKISPVTPQKGKEAAPAATSTAKPTVLQQTKLSSTKAAPAPKQNLPAKDTSTNRRGTARGK